MYNTASCSDDANYLWTTFSLRREFSSTSKERIISVIFSESNYKTFVCTNLKKKKNTLIQLLDRRNEYDTSFGEFRNCPVAWERHVVSPIELISRLLNLNKDFSIRCWRQQNMKTLLPLKSIYCRISNSNFSMDVSASLYGLLCCIYHYTSQKILNNNFLTYTYR